MVDEKYKASFSARPGGIEEKAAGMASQPECRLNMRDAVA